ncbi:MAG: hypothetical protein LUG88_08445, partial [Clostridia bacterium]|nr:hypothetical protein [Clostridia bacterium]
MTSSANEKKSGRDAILFAVGKLGELYPDAVCSLDYVGDPWRLLIMARLSAQCTDARVNIVCGRLVAHFTTPVGGGG